MARLYYQSFTRVFDTTEDGDRKRYGYSTCSSVSAPSSFRAARVKCLYVEKELSEYEVPAIEVRLSLTSLEVRYSHLTCEDVGVLILACPSLYASTVQMMVQIASTPCGILPG